MVVLDLETDGSQSEDEIVALLKNELMRGRLDQFSVSPEGFQFNLVRKIGGTTTETMAN